VINKFIKKLISIKYNTKLNIMKRIITIAAVILTTAILTSCNKTNHTPTAPNGMFGTLFGDKKDLASGD